MTSLIELKKWKNENTHIENIVIFVSDSLRWDHLPKTIMDRGITFKTVASSLFTASSFPSIVSGLYPHHHNVFSFFDRISKKTQTLLNLQGYNTSLWSENTWVDFKPLDSSPIHKMLRSNNPRSLKEIETPFIYIEDEKGGHCPYGWTEDDIYNESDCIKFFRDYGMKKIKELRERYKKGVLRSVNEFEKRLDILHKRKLIDKTLVIFLSDHGELLGEYGGIIGHQNPTSPEITYVPTVLIHPNLPKGTYFDDGLLRHVDIFPSILDLLKIKQYGNLDGINIFNAKKLPDFGFCYWKCNIKKNRFVNLNIIEKSVWDRNGGYLFRDGAKSISRLVYFIYFTLISNNINSVYLKSRLRKFPLKTMLNYPKMLNFFCNSIIKYGNPSINFKKAKELILTIEKKHIEYSEKDRIRDEINRLMKQGKI